MPSDLLKPTEFRFGLADRLGIGLTTGLLWALLIGMASGAAAVLMDGEYVAALVLAVAVIFFLQLANIVIRDCQMKWGWRLSLGREEAWLRLPTGRLLFGRAPAFDGSLHYDEIRNLEWREEAITSLGMVTINQVYAIRLRDGRIILLGEDRPIPRTSLCTTLGGEAAQALARAAGVPLKRQPMVRGEGGFLTLWGTSRPEWPGTDDTAGMSEADERAMHRRLLMTNLIPAAAFAAVLLVVSLSGTRS
jgi:hypothetical protein